MTPEGKVKNKVVKILKKLGAYYFFPATGGYGRSGVPDIVACLDGQFVAIECKAGKNPMTPLQEREMRNIQTSKGVGLCVNEENVDVLESALQSISTTLRTAMSACVSGTGRGVLILLDGNRLELHGLNIGEESAVELIRTAIDTCKPSRVLQ